MKPSDISKGLLSEALLLLMKKKDYDSITIKEIAEKAGVSRLTFYRNFDTKEDILKWHIDCGFQDYLAEISKISDVNLKSALSQCFSFWQTRSDEIIMFNQQKMTYVIQQPFEFCMRTLMDRLSILQNISPAQRHFLIGGMFSAMIEWISTGHASSSDSVTEEILSMFSDVFLQKK